MTRTSDLLFSADMKGGAWEAKIEVVDGARDAADLRRAWDDRLDGVRDQPKAPAPSP